MTVFKTILIDFSGKMNANGKNHGNAFVTSRIDHKNIISIVFLIWFMRNAFYNSFNDGYKMYYKIESLTKKIIRVWNHLGSVDQRINRSHFF